MSTHTVVILVFPCFPMCFTFSLLLYINIGNELTYPPFIDKSILKKMLVGNSRNFPFCNFKIRFLIIWEIYIYIYDYYISISWEYYIPFQSHFGATFLFRPQDRWESCNWPSLLPRLPPSSRRAMDPWPWPWPPWSRIPRGICF